MDANDQVLYVGKAKNLRNRVRSYTQATPDMGKTFTLVNTASKLQHQVLESELEALLVEADLIKTYHPPYNIDLKDDKSPLYIIITKEKFPRVLTARKKQLATTFSDLPNSAIFGPFSSGYSARQIIKIARSIFKFCNATAIDKKNQKACFYTHINLCSGACLGKISEKEYGYLIKNLKFFLAGKRMVLIQHLKQEMKDFSAQKKYEYAARSRDQLQVLDLYFDSRKRLNFDPDIPMLQEDVEVYQTNRLVQLLHTAGLVPTNYNIRRIEAYDISNTSGQNSTASMVVMENGKPVPSEYRKFKIKYIKGPNDYGMMKETLLRRLNHPEWPFPDLVVIDGGKGQLKAAYSIIQGKFPTISLVKRPDRLVIPQFSIGPSNYLLFPLEAGKPISKMMQQIRDEAHRFAKAYHSQLRTRDMLEDR